MSQFIVARNPQPGSGLPYVLGLPLSGGMVWFKAREDWPRATRVYCHPLEFVPDLDQLEILQRVEVRVCRRIGPAIDLILARRLNKRAQFVFSRWRGRELIFWQTAQSARAARPGLRVPSRDTRPQITLYVDTRERYGYSFIHHAVTVERRHLTVDDYAALRGDAIFAAVERKRLSDFATSLVDGSLNFVLAELSTVPCAAVAVEGTYSALMRYRFTRPAFLLELIARVQSRYPQISINFLESHKIAEEWVYRFLRAAYANAPTLTEPGELGSA
jgi:hypothetical protein